jgi:PKD repeat protein
MKVTTYISLFLLLALSASLTAQNTQSYNYTYDQLNRLTKVQYGNGTIIDYSYDEVGNRLAKVVNGSAAALPDLAPLGGYLSSAAGLPGTQLTITWSENNLGAIATSASETVVVALSADNLYQSGTDIQLATQVVSTGFAAGGSQSITKTITIPAGTSAGAWKILLVSDSGNAVSEISEGNNVQVLNFVVMASCGGLSVTFPTVAPDTCNSYKGSIYTSVTGGLAPYAYNWSTGSEAVNQVYTLSPGVYTVTVTSANGCTVSASTTVGNVPQAFPAFTYSGNVFTVNFTNNSTNATTYSWNFGNGTTSTATNPTVTYASAGTYSVCLTADNNVCPPLQTCYQVVVSGNGCDIPTGLNASALSGSNATISWNASAGATSYNLKYRIVGTSTWSSPISVSASSYSFTNLSLGTPYECQIEAICPQGNSGYGASFFFVTGGTPVSSDVFMLQFSNAAGFGTFIHDKTSGGVHHYGFLQNFTPAQINFTQLSSNYSNTNWSKIFTSSSLYLTTDVLTQEDGSSIMVSTPEGVGVNGATTVMKVTNTGSVAWAKSVYTPTNMTSGGFPKRIIKLSNGNLLVAGHLQEAQSFTLSYHAAFVFEIDQNGNILWEKEYPYSPSNNTYSHWLDIAELSDGYFAVGDAFSSISGSAFNQSIMYAKLQKNANLNLNGNVVYSKRLNIGTGDYYGAKCFKLPDGNIGIAAMEKLSSTTGKPVIIKINVSDGSIAWSKKFDISTPTNEFSINVLPDNGIVAWLSGVAMKFNNTGTLVWSKKTTLTAAYKRCRSIDVEGTDLFFMIANDGRLLKMKSDGSIPSCYNTDFFYSTIDVSFSVLDLAIGNNIKVPTVGTLSISESTSSNTITDLCPSCNTTALIAPLSSYTICNNQNIILTSISTGATNYSWYLDSLNTNAIGTGATVSLNFTTSGTKKVYLVATNGNCTSNTFISLTINEAPSFTISTTPETCNGDNGSAAVNLLNTNQGVTYLWSNNQTTQAISNQSEGTYQVVVTGANGCISPAQSALITNTSAGMSLIDTVSNVSCFGQSNGSIKLGINNGVAPINYLWNNGSTTRILGNLNVGQYSVTVQDGAGCIQQRTYIITQPAKFELSINPIDITICGGTNGSATANALGGTPPFQYAWSNTQTAQTAVNLAMNNYYLTVTDSKGCTVKNAVSIGTQTQKPDTIYSHTTLSGISNVVLRNGKFSFMAAKDPASHFSGYPDTLSQFVKLDLVNESGVLYNLESSPAAAHLIHGNLTLTPDHKLSMVYQAPTGNMYGFRGMRRIYNTGTTLSTNEMAFADANWGAWMRHQERDTVSRIISFSHADYYALLHKKSTNVGWNTSSLGGPNYILSEIMMAAQNDTLHYSGVFNSSSPAYLKYRRIWTGGGNTFNFTSITPTHNCDVIRENTTGNMSLLVNQRDTLLRIYSIGNNWYSEVIAFQPGFDHRASMFFRSNGNLVVAYQGYNKLVVMEKNKISSLWSVLYVHNYISPSEQIGGTRAPSLVMKGTDLWVIYCDANRVFKYNLDLPCNSVQLSAKVFLQGAYNASAGLMSDQLRSLNLLPTNEPYANITGFTQIGGGGEKIPTGLLTETGSNAIVDWVFLQLRDPGNGTTVVATRSALLQRDGDIVDIDGISPVTFKNVIPGNYYVSVRHRNHLGVRSNTVISLGRQRNGRIIDFTSSLSNANKPVGHTNEVMANLGSNKFGLWAGNANGDTYVKMTGPFVTNNDYLRLLNVLGASTNILSNVYSQQDLNMDGYVKMTGPFVTNNDYLRLLNVLGASTNSILQAY